MNSHLSIHRSHLLHDEPWQHSTLPEDVVVTIAAGTAS